MNKAITDGLVLMPPAFASGLDVWSSENGTPGSVTYDGAANAALVPADQDFGGALELLKQSTTTKLRYMGETPVLPGCYLRVTARVKAVSGNLPGVRIAGWAGNSSFNHVSGVTETGPEVTLTTYGEVVEISAIIATGSRSGVDMAWGSDAVYGHVGLDLTGANGGVVRIDDLIVEDITSAFIREMIDIVDVRDFGAVGDGVTDDHAAIVAAANAANGKTVLIPEGTYYASNHLTFVDHARFEGTMSMPDDKRLALRRDFHMDAYIDAFGNEELAFKKALQAHFYFTDHDMLDMRGRRIELTGPIDVQANTGGLTKLEVRRVLYNGSLSAEANSNWDVETVTSSGTYNTANPRAMTGVSNIANIQIGSIMTGTGVGREVYVRDVNVGAGSLTLSQPLYGPATTQTYTFTRHKYMLDFSGFDKISKFSFAGVEFQLQGHASAVLLPPDGEAIHFRDCPFKRLKYHGISSHGGACQDLQIDRCTFYSDESPLASTARTSVGFNVNANDSKIRNNRFQHLGHTAILNGNGHLIVGNHWFQGDGVTDGPRVGGLIFTYPNVKSVVTGNYIDNNFIEWTNEHDATPDFSSEYSFGGLTITGNIFTCNDVASWFSWLVIKPYGPGHFIQGLSVQGNTFKSLNGFIDRIEQVDNSIASLDFGRTRNVNFVGNTYNGVSDMAINPAVLEFEQTSGATNWSLDVSSYLPFGGWSRTVEAVVVEGKATNNSGDTVWAMPYVTPNHGSNNNLVQLTWPEATKGKVQVTVRMDHPV